MMINHLKLLQLESDGDQNNAEFMVDLNNLWEALPPDGDAGANFPSIYGAKSSTKKEEELGEIPSPHQEQSEAGPGQNRVKDDQADNDETGGENNQEDLGEEDKEKEDYIKCQKTSWIKLIKRRLFLKQEEFQDFLSRNIMKIKLIKR